MGVDLKYDERTITCEYVPTFLTAPAERSFGLESTDIQWTYSIENGM